MKKMKFVETRCVGCYACHVACIDSHFDVQQDNVKSMRGTKNKIEKDGYEKKISPGCVHCGICASACEFNAILLDENTELFIVDMEKCIGCRKCQTACPQQLIWFDSEQRAKKCDGCIERIQAGREPACVRVCNNHAIIWEEER